MIRFGIIGTRRYIGTGDVAIIAERILASRDTKWIQVAIVTGDAKGVDKAACDIGKSMGVTYVEFHAPWLTLKNGAGPIRTRMVVDYCHFLLAIYASDSKGTIRGLERATERGIDVYSCTLESIQEMGSKVAPIAHITGSGSNRQTVEYVPSAP